MKEIRFKKLRLLNFCGIREGEFEFGEHITTVSAANGMGKSTIAKAFTYVLFGTDLNGSSLDIKTYDENHNIIPEIDHSAELVLSVDGEEMTLKRLLTDSWNDEKVKNTYKYFIDGELVTSGDYKKAIGKICNDNIFRLSSSCTCFLEKTWQEQRKVLECMVNEVSSDEVTRGEEKFDFVVKALQKESMDKLYSHIRYKRGEVQEQLDKIPTRLSELDKALPEKKDWESMKLKKEELKKQLTSLQEKEANIKNGNANIVKNEGLRHKIEFCYKRKDLMERSAREKSSDDEVKHSASLVSARVSNDKAASMVEELSKKLLGFDDTEKHAKEQIEECKRNVGELNQKLDEASSREWEWNAKDSICPHCGQELTFDKLHEIMEESKKRFNDRKANDIKAIQDTFARVKKEYKELKDVLEQIADERSQTSNQLANAQKAKLESENHLKEVEDEKVLSYKEILASKEEYQQVVGEIKTLEEELNKPVEEDGEKEKILSETKKEIESVRNEISDLLIEINKENSYTRVSKLIEKANEDKKTFQEQLDDIDEQMDIAKEYYQRSCEVLEGKLNSLFGYVKWSMSQVDLDGNRKPYCECYHNGVPYSKMNTADQMNAGIDVANVISEFYEVSVPMLIDGCESNLHPIYNGKGQQIRFCVSPDEKITIREYGD